MRSIGIDLEPWEKQGLLRFHSKRPTFYGLESYLTAVHKHVKDFKPAIVILDPISSFIIGSDEIEAKAMIMRLVDFLKMNHITGFMTSLTVSGTDLEHTEINISSLIDTWLLLRDIEIGGERNRGLYILKSRGMSHSNQIREFRLSNQGIELLDVYVGPSGVLTGSARISQEAKEKAEKLMMKQMVDQKKIELERKRKAMEAQIAALQAEFEADETEVLKMIALDEAKSNQLLQNQLEMAVSRKADQNIGN
jgi:circadian clock protein KaiC